MHRRERRVPCVPEINLHQCFLGLCSANDDTETSGMRGRRRRVDEHLLEIVSVLTPDTRVNEPRFRAAVVKDRYGDARAGPLR